MAKSIDDIDLIQSIKVDINLVDNNEGQIPGVKKNPRECLDVKYRKLKKSLQRDAGLTAISELKIYPFQGRWVTIGGNMRLHAMKELGWKQVIGKPIPVDTPPEVLNRLIILDNSNFGQWDFDALANEWDEQLLSDLAVDIPNLNDALEQRQKEEEERELRSLTADFFQFPQSVLDTRRAEWQERKRAWRDMGLRSEDGRGSELTFSPTALSPDDSTRVSQFAAQNGLSKTEAARTLAARGELKSYLTTSIFDPVLCETCYRWFNVKHGKILDPFAGGSVRGIVASALQMPYFGNDLREEQIEANIRNLDSMMPNIIHEHYIPKWTVGDSADIDRIIKQSAPELYDAKADMIFSCPPYADLEQYSDKKEDLSNMSYEDFLKAYRTIIAKSCALLKNNRFAVFVVGDIRDKRGFCRNFVNDTIAAFQAAGLKYYGQLVLVTPAGPAAIRARKAFETRKIVKTHQQVIVAFKGEDLNAKAEGFEQLSVSKSIKHFNDQRIPIDTYDYVQVFYKGDAPPELPMTTLLEESRLLHPLNFHNISTEK